MCDLDCAHHGFQRRLQLTDEVAGRRNRLRGRHDVADRQCVVGAGRQHDAVAAFPVQQDGGDWVRKTRRK